MRRSVGAREYFLDQATVGEDHFDGQQLSSYDTSGRSFLMVGGARRKNRPKTRRAPNPGSSRLRVERRSTDE